MPEKVKIKHSVAFLQRKPLHDCGNQMDAHEFVDSDGIDVQPTSPNAKNLNADVVEKKSAPATINSKDKVGWFYDSSASLLERKEFLRSRVDLIIQFIEQKCS